MNQYVKMFTDRDLAPEVLKGKGKVLVDFWASWCGPCRMLAPTVDEIAEEMHDTLTVGKLNIDDYTDCAISLGIASIPTLVLFEDGAEKDRIVGLVPKEIITEWIQKA